MRNAPTNGRYRTVIIIETLLCAVALLLLVGIMLYAFAYGAFGVSWFSVGIAASAMAGELVRRTRHLRNDWEQDRKR